MNGTSLARVSTRCLLEIHKIDFHDFVTIQSASILMCVVNSLSAVLAVTANGLIIISICKTPSLRSPPNLLICFLAITDFLSGLITQPAFVLDKVARLKFEENLFCISALTTFVSGYVSSGVSFLTLSAISTERLLALKLHLRYPQYVTNRRVLIVEASIWTVCCLAVLLPFLGYMNVFQIMLAIFGVTSLFINLITYCVIFRVVKKHQQRVQMEIQLAGHFHGPNAREMRNLKHSSWTLAFICFLYFLCYVPFIAIKISESFSVESSSSERVLAQEVNETLILVTACINPVVYFYRLSDLRRSVLNAVNSVWFA